MGDLCTAGGGPPVVTFVAMWAVMMIPMMLPSLVPSLRGYSTMSGPLIAGSAYLLVWIAAGLAAYAIHAIVVSAPLMAGIVVVACGLLQLSPWKARRLEACRVAHVSATASAPARQGLRLGVDCVARCASLVVTLVAVGVMDWAAMIVATAAITIERYAPRAAKPIGMLLLTIGAMMVARTL